MDYTLTASVENSQLPIRLLQITDCHIGPDDTEELLGLNTNESLHDVLAHVIAQQTQPYDMLLATGDIANNGGARTYRRFLTLLEDSSLQFNHFAWLPGNHDSPVDMLEAQDRESLVKRVDIGNWTLVLLNSQVPGHTHGNLNGSELNLLDEILSHTADRHVLVFLHHQPLVVGCAWLDTQKVRADFAFFKVLDQYTHVRGVVWGHVHQEFSADRQGVPFMSTPSTCIQFKTQSDEFAIENLMPGYRWFELLPDGEFNTSVVRIPQKSYPIEFNSEGY
ncbi:3',5'-cyclic-AMP phosphodiesterase [Aurantivibrio plasticivorans]